MPSKTPNLNLTTFNIQDDMGDFLSAFKTNMETIDSAIKALQDKVNSMSSTSSSSTSSSS